MACGNLNSTVAGVKLSGHKHCGSRAKTAVLNRNAHRKQNRNYISLYSLCRYSRIVTYGNCKCVLFLACLCTEEIHKCACYSFYCLIRELNNVCCLLRNGNASYVCSAFQMHQVHNKSLLTISSAASITPTLPEAKLSPPCIHTANGSRSGASAESSIDEPDVNAPADIITLLS